MKLNRRWLLWCTTFFYFDNWIIFLMWSTRFLSQERTVFGLIFTLWITMMYFAKMFCDIIKLKSCSEISLTTSSRFLHVNIMIKGVIKYLNRYFCRVTCGWNSKQQYRETDTFHCPLCPSVWEDSSYITMQYGVYCVTGKKGGS